jgi:formylglycine-generating enzyme
LLISMNACKQTVQKNNVIDISVAEQDIIKNMILIPTGDAHIGNNKGFAGEMPEFTMHINAFYIDVSPVTVNEFKTFVDQTNYITEAEKFGNAEVFNLQLKQWQLIEGATWKYPEGPDGQPAEGNHPVTQVSYHDALAYCAFVHKRLPTEFEWEYAARNASSTDMTYSWGNSLVENGKYMANTWQGSFPEKNLQKDKYLYTCPVGTFGKNNIGLTDMGGNVWQWTSSWYQPYQNSIQGITDSSFGQKTIRGGSFLCDTAFCCGYRVSARTSVSEESSLFHVGFRCAYSQQLSTKK